MVIRTIAQYMAKRADVVISEPNGSGLDELRNLATELKDMIKHQIGTATTYKLDNGMEGVGYGLWKEPAYAVQRCFVPKGGIFSEHHHNTYEIVVVVIGKFKTVLVDENGGRIEKLMKAGDVSYYNPHQTHEFTALTDGWVVGITIPADEGYPDASQL